MNSTQAQFEARQTLFNDAVGLNNTGRIPVICAYSHYLPTRQAGMTNKEAMYDHDKTFKACKDFILRYDFDLAFFPALFPAQGHDILGIKSLKWPGAGLGEDAPFQYVEGEYLREDEYDEYLEDPDGFVVKTIWPRISSLLAPLAEIEFPPVRMMSDGYTLPGILGSVVSDPRIMNILEELVALGREMGKFSRSLITFIAEMQELGYPCVSGGEISCPFDTISTLLRGMEGSMVDMFRQPDKILATIEKLTPQAIMGGIAICQMTQVSRIGLPLFRGSKGFMSDEQFEKFYWPSLKELINSLVDSGITPIVIFEGDYTPRLHYLKELPRGKVAAHFEHVDRKKFKEVLGDHMCFWGNVPASTLMYGTREKVEDEVKALIDTLGDTGGLIIDGAQGIPDEATAENVAAMVETARAYN